MVLADTLSHRDDVDISLDSTDIQLLPCNTFNQQIQAINVALVDKIKDLSSNNPLVLQVVHQIEKELSLFNRSHAKDWTFNNGWLYFKHHLYVSEVAYHDLVSTAHCSFKGGHGGHLQTIVLLSKDY